MKQLLHSNLKVLTVRVNLNKSMLFALIKLNKLLTNSINLNETNLKALFC